MEIAKKEIEAIQQAVQNDEHQGEVSDLAELQLVLVGGGIGNVILG